MTNHITAAKLAANATDQFDPLEQAAVELITNALTTTNGLTHPNRPDIPVQMLGLRATGLPPEMAEAVKTAGRSIAEALIHMITTNLRATLISTDELAQLRATATNTRPDKLTLTCDHGTLLTLAIPAGIGNTNVNCQLLRTNLQQCQP